MKIIIKILFVFVFYSTLSCNQQNDLSKAERYDKIASEFITQIFYTENHDCSYIIKPNSEYNLLESIEEKMPALNYRSSLMEILKIGKKETLDSLLDISNDFEFRDSMFNSSSELIDNNQFKVIKTKLDSIAKYGTEKEIKQLFSECPTEFYFISKPLFDKEFKTAIIDIQMGFVCIRRSPRVFELNNGIWETQK